MRKVTAGIIFDNDLVLIAKRKSENKDKNKWEFPGGKVEEGETNEECLKRELFEEFGAEADIGGFFGETIYNYKDGSIQLIAFYASLRSSQITLTVHEEYKWVKPEELNLFEFLPADVYFVNKLVELTKSSV